MARPKNSPRGVKSQAIRDYLTTNKRAKPAQVIAALAEKGVSVSSQMVSHVKARSKMRRRRRKAEAGGQTVGLSITNLIAAKKLVDTVGGIEKAREAINALAKLA